MNERDEMTADAFADREPVRCGECAGTGHRLWFDDYDTPCSFCGGTGVWAGR